MAQAARRRAKYLLRKNTAQDLHPYDKVLNEWEAREAKDEHHELRRKSHGPGPRFVPLSFGPPRTSVRTNHDRLPSPDIREPQLHSTQHGHNGVQWQTSGTAAEPLDKQKAMESMFDEMSQMRARLAGQSPVA